MKIAVIDIGTNTVLLLIAALGRGLLQTIVYEQRTPRLGKGVDESRTLQRDAINRVVAVLKEYRKIIASESVDAIVVAGTSAFRDAVNRQEVIGRIRDEVGLDMEVLTGEEEALWTFQGAISGIAEMERTTVIDIGGGSTEIITGSRSGIDSRISLDIGSVRLTERFFHSDPPDEPEITKMEQFLRSVFRNVDRRPEASSLIGVAGTAASLAILDQGLKQFDRNAVTNYVLTLAAVDGLVRMLRRFSSTQIRGLSDVMAGREDVITAGALIMKSFMEMFGFERMIVSERGIRYGLAIREWEKRGFVTPS